MALFDIFGIGSSPDYLSGFLSEEERRRLQERAGQNALLQAGLGMLGQSGYSRVPVSLGQIIGAGGQAGLQAYQGTMQQGAQDLMMRQRMEEMKRQRQTEEARKAYLSQFANTLPAEQQQALMAFPEVGQKLVESRLLPSKDDFMKVSEGEQVINPRTGATVFAGSPKTPFKIGETRTVRQGTQQLTQEYQGADKGWVTIGTGEAFAPPSQTTVNVAGEQKAEAKAVGEFFGKQYSDILTSGFNAGKTIDKVNRLNQLLEGVNTGKLTPAGTQIASTAASLGFDVNKNLGNLQAAEALSNEFALTLRNPSGGAGMPGALSDKDREFLKAIVPGIEKTPEGRKLISESMIKLAKREQDVARLAREYRKKNGQLDEGFYDELSRYSEQNPLFADTGATSMQGGTGGFKIRRIK